ncbi:uncharacterized protein LOC125370008 [Ricinus communis]|uniref:uncharacterized protein LOC125370008 n=1 Tax=Ricinus communis TaxID=3988 RepID=UPI00201AA955|nr:uncharacterized protein LOC125370008 [Ricinus communis]
MANRTLKELAAPDLNQQSLCITFPNIAVDFELKSGLIHLLPSFHGCAGEDPHKHLKEFHIDKARDWLYYLPSSSITTWNEMKRLFLDKFFPATRAANIRKEICGITQFTGETLYEYWERFKQLCASCPHHQISQQLLIQYFYEGLLPMDRNMIAAASGGALVDKTPKEAKQLISNMAENSQQFGTRADGAIRRVNKVSTKNLKNQISDLTALVCQMVVGQLQMAKVYGICLVQGHPTDMCPTLQQDLMQEANALGGFTSQLQRKYDPFSNQYNHGWRDHLN